MKLFSLLVSNLLFLFCFSQDLSNSLLWKVEKEGIEPSYIFGTIHVLPQSEFELEEKVKTAMDASEELVLEIDMTDPALQTKMFQTMAMQDGMTLDKLLTEEEYEKLSEKLKSIPGAPPIAMVNGFKPFMVATMMLSEYVGSQPASFEMTLISMASKREMPISGLETIESQMAIFDSIPYEDQADDLMDMVEEGDEMKALFSDMIAQYKAEEINALYETTEEYTDSDDEMRFLLHTRNANWAEALNDKLGEKTLFIAVGAAHLGGEEGVINLLKEQGYQLTPLMD
ncbi:MAG TPA: TraB/GumN family protein [Cryomorphaceae bacterium]|nr:TraB/GumN family protein [Cryomorphaceae bacterium]